MAESPYAADPFSLEDGARIGVIGGGPTGSFFSIFALMMARRLGKDLTVTIFEPRDFRQDGPAGCNHCGGVISELLVQTLAVEGITLPDSVVRRGINAYNLHTEQGSVSIATPDHEKTIATVSRGAGPKGMGGEGKSSFDDFLLGEAIRAGAVHRPHRIDRITREGGRPQLFSHGEQVLEADLVVGAMGVNSTTTRLFEELAFGYKGPPTISTAIAELRMGEEVMAGRFGAAIHLFLLSDRNLKFAALIPKGGYATLCLLGKDMTTAAVDSFLSSPVVKDVLPDSGSYTVQCRCLPKMNVGAPPVAFTDRVVLCGDAGSTRLFKDGLGAAYLMGKAAAKTAVFQGVSRHHFEQDYSPTYKSIITDNLFGRFLFAVTDTFRKHATLTEGMLGVVRKEQERSDRPRPLSSILWNMFTGNERYKNVFYSALNPGMHLDLGRETGKAVLRRMR